MSAAKMEETEEQFCKRAAALYEKVVKPKLTPDDVGKFVAIDANTGEFEVHDQDVVAGERLFARLPEAKMWLERAGFPTAYRILRVQ